MKHSIQEILKKCATRGVFFALVATFTLPVSLPISFFVPFSVHAATNPAPATTPADFQVSGWIPYWQVREGVADAKRHLDVLTEINPFAFVVKTDGSLKDMASLRKSTWTRLFKSAKSKKVQVIPTVMWSDAVAMQAILSNPDSRKDHVEAIALMVKRGKYDGVDIDYEGKKSETKDHFSAFLKELKAELGSKILSCAIEARTPPDSLYLKIPVPLIYANDYDAIGRHCDKVKIMAYDQQRADITLNSAKKGMPYIAVADTDWVRKVVTFALFTIPKEKILIGVPTYGRVWDVTVGPEQFKEYRQVTAINHVSAVERAGELGVMPARNLAGELSFTYMPETYIDPISLLIKSDFGIPVPVGTSDANRTAARALSFSTLTQQNSRVYLTWWSDAEAIRQKVALAKELGVAGVAIFKIDGEEDPAMWDIF